MHKSSKNYLRRAASIRRPRGFVFGRKSRVVPKWFKSAGVSLGLLLLGHNINVNAQPTHLGGGKPPLSPAMRARITGPQVNISHFAPFGNVLDEAAWKYRVSYNLSEGLGPVAVTEIKAQNGPSEVNTRAYVGLAQGVNIGQNTLVNLGVLSPNLKLPDSKDYHLGVMLSHTLGSGAQLLGEAHKYGDSHRVSLGYKTTSGVAPTISLGNNWYFDPIKTGARIGVIDFQKAVGIKSEKWYTDLGIAFGEGSGRREVEVDVGVMYFPSRKFGVYAGGQGIGSKNPSISAFAVFNLGTSRPKQRRFPRGTKLTKSRGRN